MNDSNPIISVIVPVYNVENYLAKCIDSILNQSFKNFELLLIDDGSLDNSGMICDEYSLIDKRIKVFHIQNGGVSKARNLGIYKSIGFYISFVDSDDILLSDYFERMYEVSRLANNCNADVVSSGFTLLSTYTGKKTVYIAPPCKLYTKKDFRSHISDLEGSKIFNGPCNKLFRKDILILHDIKFPESLSFGEDLIFSYDYLSKCKTLVNIDYSGYVYLQTGKGLSGKHYSFDVYDKLIEKQYEAKCKFIENNIEGEAIWTYVDDTIIWRYTSFWQSLILSTGIGESLKNLRKYLDKYLSEKNYLTYKLSIVKEIKPSIVSKIILIDDSKLILFFIYCYSKSYFVYKKIKFFLKSKCEFKV
ncbi:glycosyltransferase family 2 protein [Bacteroides sedimenti]|uniref:Glycosyl transferase n=1 Tax=Bacteroides sedimenti TaxID=2136147 RepID=A0ABM8I6Z7_9BACE